MTAFNHKHENWPVWAPGLKLAAKHLYGLESYLLSRANVSDSLFGLAAFDLHKSLKLEPIDGQYHLSIGSLRGVTPLGQPVVLGVQDHLKHPTQGDCFDAAIVVRGGEEMPKPDDQDVRRLSPKLTVVNSPDAKIEMSECSLYLGRFSIQGGTIKPLNVPWVRTFSALAPRASYQTYFKAFDQGIQVIVGDALRKGTNSTPLDGARMAIALELAYAWPILPLNMLAAQCHTLNRGLRLRSAQDLAEMSSPFDWSVFFDNLSGRPPTPADFASLMSQGWQPGVIEYRQLETNEYQASSDISNGSLMISISTYVAGEMVIQFPPDEVRRAGVNLPLRLRVRWLRGDQYVEVDQETLSMKIQLGPDMSDQQIMITGKDIPKEHLTHLEKCVRISISTNR